MIRFATAAITLALVLGSATSADAAARFGIFIGSNLAPVGKSKLRFAHRDARRLRAVLTRLGRLPKKNTTLLLDPKPQHIDAAIATIVARAKKEAALVFFYYSGHADKSGFLLGSQRYPIARVRSFLAQTQIRVRVAILDACQSGAFSKVKGGRRVKGYKIAWRSPDTTRGAVMITSSSAEEASVESDELGGSLFSHFLSSALRGAGDKDGDGKVTLGEAFSYARYHTMERSARTRAGMQRPRYELRLGGQQELVLSWLPRRAALTFGKNAIGSYLIFDRKRSRIVAELVKEAGSVRRVWVGPGDYFVKKRLPHAVLLTKVALSSGEVKEIKDGKMKTVPYDEDVTKGYDGKIFRPTWRYGAPPVLNTAFTLRRNEFTTGLFYPVSWGVSDSVTVYTVLLGWLVLTPSIIAKVRLLHGDRWAWSFQWAFMYSFFERVISTDNGTRASRSTFFLAASTFFSAYLGRYLLATVSAGWSMISGPNTTDTLTVNNSRYHVLLSERETHSAFFTAGVHLLFTESDYFLLTGHYSTQADLGVLNPSSGTGGVGSSGFSARLTYAHAWSVFRLEIGAIYGDNGISKDVPVLPWIDLWWRW
jgi:hypothetical protein